MGKIIDFINSAMIGTVAYTPTTPYTGKLPTKVVRKGSRGSSVKAVQSFLNWCIGTKLTVDGIAGTNTVKAIKKYQKRYGLSKDGIFGSKCLAKAKKIIKAHKPAPSPTPTVTKQHKAVELAKDIAKDNSYGYVKWGKESWRKLCCICHGYTGKKKGFNCIRFVFTCWHHAGIPVVHEGGCISNDVAENMYRVDIKEAKKIAQKKLKCKDLTVIRNKKGIPKSIIKEGDAGALFNGNTYVHLILLDGKGKMIHAQGSNGKVPKDRQIEYRSAYTPRMIIRYTGK